MWSLLCVILLVPRMLRYFLDFWICVVAYALMKCKLYHYYIASGGFCLVYSKETESKPFQKVVHFYQSTRHHVCEDGNFTHYFYYMSCINCMLLIRDE